jgi:hypothetical protein
MVEKLDDAEKGFDDASTTVSASEIKSLSKKSSWAIGIVSLNL